MVTEHNLEELLEFFPRAMAVVDAQGSTIQTNRQFEAEYPGVDSMMVFLTEVTLRQRFHSTLASGQKFTNRCPRGKMEVIPWSDGKFLVWMESYPPPFADFQQLVESLTEVVLVVSMDGVCLWANRQDLQWVLSSHLQIFTPPTVYDQAKAAFDEVIKTRKMVSVEFPPFMTAEGTLAWYQARWVPLFRDTELAYVAIVATDVTNRHQQEAEVRRSEERFRNLFNNSMDVIGAYSTDLTLQFITPNVVEHIGFEAEDLIGKNLRDFVEMGELVHIQEAVESMSKSPNTPHTLEVRVPRPDGTESILEARVRLLESENQEPVIFMNARDISARRELETMRQNMVRADKLASIGQIAAGVAHEINNPATFISTNLFVLREYARKLLTLRSELKENAAFGGEQLLKYLDEIEYDYLLEDMVAMIDTNLEGIDRISLIVRDLRTFSREDAEELELVDPNTVIETAASIVRNQVSLSGELILDLNPVQNVLAHPGKLAQVLVNLLVNAAQAISKRGGDQKVILRSFRTDGEVRISVSDTGPGIPKDILPRVFEPFFTTKEPEHGTGLGLWLCQEILKRLRGDISVETGNSGTTFTVILPGVSSLEENSDFQAD